MKKIAIIGGGAAGMACAVQLARNGSHVTLLERGERLGKKLSATGNGQGNVTNVNMGAEHYFSDCNERISRVLSRFSYGDTIAFLESMGGIFLPDARGRVYPAGRQASAVTDLFRRELSSLGVDVLLNAKVESLEKEDCFLLHYPGGSVPADAVVLAAGGRAAPSFGTDGNAYALAERFGHSVTTLSPALVQLKSDPSLVRGLKGIRVDGSLRVLRRGRSVFECRGDVLFTESGLSGDAVFRASSYAAAGDEIEIDLLPSVEEERVLKAVKKDLYCVVNNMLGRVLKKRAGENEKKLVELIKHFTLPVTGTLGFSYAQVTRGGIPLSEVDDCLMSKKVCGLYFAGEILNVDGECGGYNLQWAFASSHTVAEALLC